MMVVVEWLEPVEAEPFAAVIEAAIATSSFGHPFDLLVPYSSMVGSGHKDNTSANAGDRMVAVGKPIWCRWSHEWTGR